MNTILLILSLIVFPSVVGCGMVKAYVLIKAKLLKAGSHKRESAFCRFATYFSTGALVLLVLSGLINILAVFTNMTISASGRLFIFGTLLFSLLSLVFIAICFLAKKNNPGIPNESSEASNKKPKLQTVTGHPSKGKISLILGCVAAITAIIQIALITFGKQISYTGDQTLETVVSFISTDHIYSVDPLTGLPFLNDYPFRLALQCLPFFYSVLAKFFSVSPLLLVWQIMPAFWLVCGYCTIYRIADSIFKKDYAKILMFICFELLLWCSDAAFGATGFNVFHAGYNSVVVLELLLIYWTVGTLLRRHRLAVVLPIIAEPMVASTSLGVGACFFIALFYIILSKIPAVKQLVSRVNGRDGGEHGKD